MTMDPAVPPARALRAALTWCSMSLAGAMSLAEGAGWMRAKGHDGLLGLSQARVDAGESEQDLGVLGVCIGGLLAVLQRGAVVGRRHVGSSSVAQVRRRLRKQVDSCDRTVSTRALLAGCPHVRLGSLESTVPFVYSSIARG